MTAAPILEVRDLHKSYGGTSVLKGLDFEVTKGAVLGVTGQNGAGKTTLLNIISGLISGTGTVRFEGKPVGGLAPHELARRGIARTFQAATAFPDLTVRENVFCGSYFGSSMGRDEAWDHAARMLDFVGELKGKEDLKPGSFRLFDLRMVMLAIALATRPRLLMLDEPAGGLTPAETGVFMGLIRRINQELGVTIILVEHLMKVIMGLCDELMILHSGNILVSGVPAEVAQDQRVIDVYLGAEH